MGCDIMANCEEVNIPIEFTLDKIMYTGRNGYVIARVKSSTPEIREYLNSVWKNVSIAGVMPTLKNGIVYCCTVNKIKQNSRHYAKRQYTFFNHQLPIVWFETDYSNFNNTIEQIISYIENN